MFTATVKCRFKVKFMFVVIVAAVASMVVMQAAPTFSWLLSWASEFAASVGVTASSVQALVGYAEVETTVRSGVRRFGKAYAEVSRRADDILYML